MALKLLPVGIALGSNLGNSQSELNAGIAFLRTLSTDGYLRESPRIKTTPVDCPPGSPKFLNSVAEIQLDPVRTPPRLLLEKLQSFEISRGRAKDHAHNSPRPLDLDILYYGDLILNEPDLMIPHPRAHLRRFVLKPLSHLHPELVLPGQTQSVDDLLQLV